MIFRNRALSRRQAEASLRASEMRYRRIIEGFTDYHYTVRVENGRAVETVQSSACEKVTGYTAEEFAANPYLWIQMVAPEDHDLVKVQVDKVLDGIEIPPIEHRIIRKDGELRWVRHTTILFKDAAGSLRSYDGVIHDITERVQSEESLRKSESLYRSLFENMLNGFAYCRMLFEEGKPQDFIYLAVNDAFESLTGLKDVIGRKVTEVIPDIRESDSQLFDIYGRVALSGRPERFEMFVEALQMWFSLSVYCPAHEHFVVVFDVITERKNAQEALREASERLEFALAGTNDGIWDVHLKTGDLYISPRGCEILKYSPGECPELSKNWSQLVHPDDLPDTIAALNAYFDGREPLFMVEQRLKTAAGTWKWILTRGKAVSHDSDGSPLRMVGTHTDISQRKQAEEETRNLSQRLQLATSSARLGVWDWNVRDNLMIWDDRMFELYGITRETFPDNVSAWQNGLHPEDRESAIAACRAALNGEQEFDTTFRILHPDGTVKHIKANALVIRGADGTAERMIGINSDITGMKLAEEEKFQLQAQLYQAQKIESVGRLAGGVAHDFNNMLSVILGYANVGLMDLEPTHPIRHCLDEIRIAAERSADLTRQLLAFARKQTIAPKVLDLNKNVESMLKMLQRLIGEDIDLSWKPAAHLWQIKIDPTQIDQILANLCVNARDSITDAGRITIESGNCVIDDDYCAHHAGFIPGEYVRLVVSDNGCGMDQETMTHIFEPFFTTKGLGEGTGLGLAMVYGAVKQNNGFINVYSEPDKGTTFTVYLPRHKGRDEQTAGTNKVARPASPGDETILLVEDELAILNVAAEMLTRQGYTVIRANSPSEAIHRAQEFAGEIHLLMTDVVMPEMNGLDLVNTLLPLHPDLKYLFMSGYTADVIAHHGILAKGAHFIQKPFSLSDLTTRVREVLDDVSSYRRDRSGRR